jgi:retron-type reverse transcriptase
MDRLTNPNPTVGSEVLLLNKVQGELCYVMNDSLNQSKQPTGNPRKIGGSPKDIICQKLTEFGIFRKSKDWGKRRVYSTTIICGKKPSKIMIGENWFEGQFIKSQFKKLENDLKINGKCNNLTTIISNQEFLTGCYVNIKSRKGSMISHQNPETLDEIDDNWFETTKDMFRNGKFNFEPSKRMYISKPSGKPKLLIVPSLKDDIVQKAMRTLLDLVFERYFRDSSHAFRGNRECHTTLKVIRSQFARSNWFIEGNIEHQHSPMDHTILMKLLRTRIDDEPFIDLIYKYLRVRYGDKPNSINPMAIEFMQGRNLLSILFNIYMHPFDV